MTVLLVLMGFQQQTIRCEVLSANSPLGKVPSLNFVVKGEKLSGLAALEQAGFLH